MQNKLRVVLYGAGLACEANIENIPNDWNIVAIVDKNERLWGEYFHGKYLISSPKKICEIDYDLIVMMLWKFKKEVRCFLTNMGVDPWRIVDGGRYTSQWDKVMYYKDITVKKRKILDCKYKIENRSNNSDKLLYVLIGYKDFLWEDVLSRIYTFCPHDVDVCLLSGGKYDKRLSDIAQKYHWSYLSTNVNDVTVSQNVLLSFFKNAKLIYKMDEDIYVTSGVFEKLEHLYYTLKESAEVQVGYIGPIIPLHSSSHIFLREFELEQKYKEHFMTNLIYGGAISSPKIRIEPEYAKWYWSQGGQLDVLNQIAQKKGERYEFFPLRYAICFILFSREFFEEMGGFEVDEVDNIGTGWNGDEAQIMRFCSMTGRVGIVALNSVCGHFCYPAQENEMKKFKEENKHLFDISAL